MIFDVLRFLGRVLGARVGGVEEAVAEAFHDHRDADLLRRFFLAAGDSREPGRRQRPSRIF
jgi:hypothetical protein